MLKITEPILSNLLISDTLYPVFNFVGRSGDGGLLIINTKDNTWWVCWDGPFDRNVLGAWLYYYVYDYKTGRVIDKKRIATFEKWFYLSSYDPTFFFNAFRIKNSHLLPQFELDDNATFSNPLGRAVWFTERIVMTAGLTRGPYRIYDKRYNKWTGLLVYNFSDNERGDGITGSGYADVTFGINSSGKPPSISSNKINRPLVWKIGYSTREDENRPYSVAYDHYIWKYYSVPKVGRSYSDVLRMILDKTYDPSLVIIYYIITNSKPVNNRYFTPKQGVEYA